MKNEIRNYVVLDRLQPLGGVDHRPMFDGFGLFRDGHFFGILHDGRLYLRVWPDTIQAYLDRGMAPFEPSPTTRLRHYYEVPAEVLEDPGEVRRWAEAARHREASRP